MVGADRIMGLSAGRVEADRIAGSAKALTSRVAEWRRPLLARAKRTMPDSAVADGGADGRAADQFHTWTKAAALRARGGESAPCAIPEACLRSGADHSSAGRSSLASSR